MPETLLRKEYEEILHLHPQPHCWACGRDDGSVPRWWFGPWRIERAHIVNKPRREDRRAVVLLCSACHRTSHGERLAGNDLPRLTLGNLLWLKMRFDTDFVDAEWLAAHHVGAALVVEDLPKAYHSAYASRQSA